MATLDTGWTLRLWEKAVALYEASDRVGIPLHDRTAVVRDAWREAARREMGKVAR